MFIGESEAKWFAEQLKEIGVEIVGFCCGNSATYTRALAMAYGRKPASAKYELFSTQISPYFNFLHDPLDCHHQSSVPNFIRSLKSTTQDCVIMLAIGL